MRAAVAAFPHRLRENPYCELLYHGVAALGVPVVRDAELTPGWLHRRRAEVGVLHLHWPEFYYRNPDGRVSARSLAAFVAGVLTAVALRYRIVWTVHNAQPHETSGADRLMRALLLRVATPVVHCAAARSALGRAGDAAVVIPHGSYAGWYPDVVTRADARARLGLATDARVFLWFGQVRPYKALEPLLHALHALPDESVQLLVAGRPADEATRASLTALARALGDRRIHLHLRHVPDEEVQTFFRASDLVVLPYRQVLTSGAAVLALSFGRGLIVPRLGCLADLEQAGCAIGYEPDAPGALEAALAAGVTVDAQRLGASAGRFAEDLQWDRIAAAYVRVYAASPDGRTATAPVAAT